MHTKEEDATAVTIVITIVIIVQCADYSNNVDEATRLVT
jgi:hypothetical protein